VIHGSPDAGALDTAFIGGALLFPPVEYAGATDYADLEAGAYDIEVRYTGTDVPVVQMPGTVVDAGTAVDLVIVGLVADASVQPMAVVTQVGVVQLIGRPAQVRSGGCGADLADDGVSPLTDVLSPRGDPFGQTSAAATENSFTTIPLAFDDLLVGDHAIVVSRSPDEPEVIVCGEIGGKLTDVGALVVGLREQNDSGFVGVAVLAPNVVDPTTTDVSLFLAADLAAGATAAPIDAEATEEAG
jgi:hypothetical protein